MPKTGKTQKQKQQTLRTAVFVVLLVVLGAQTYFLWKNGTLQSLFYISKTAPAKKLQKAGPTPTPTIIPLPQGKHEYTVSQGSAATGPKVAKIILDPHDPKVGEKHTIHVTAGKRLSTVESVTITVESDKKKENYPLRLVSGTAELGDWEASWTTEDTHLYSFVVTAIAKDTANRETKVEMVFRKR